MDFKRFGIWIVSFLMKQIEEIKKLLNDKLIPILCLGNIFVWSVIGQQSYGKVEDMPTFIITLIAFLAAAYAIWQQHTALKHQKEASQQQEKDNKKLLKHQKEAGIKQEIIGAWQVLANKAAGNSGKIEAIEFLAKQGKSLSGIDMSAKTNNGEVFLSRLNVSEMENVTFALANFSGADLNGANFGKSHLIHTKFEEAYLLETRFEGANLTQANFKNSRNFDKAIFGNNYTLSDIDNHLPKAPIESKLQFDFIFNEDGTKKSQPMLNKDGKKTKLTKYFIHLVPKTQNS